MMAQGLEGPTSPRASAAAAAAAALGMRNQPKAEPTLLQPRSPPCTPTASATAAAAAALAPSLPSASTAPLSRPLDSPTTTSVAAMLRASLDAVSAPPPPPMARQATGGGPYFDSACSSSPGAASPSSSSRLPPPTPYTANGLGVPDWARSYTAQPPIQTVLIPGAGHAGPIHAVPSTLPIPPPLASPLTSPRGHPAPPLGATGMRADLHPYPGALPPLATAAAGAHGPPGAAGAHGSPPLLQQLPQQQEHLQLEAAVAMALQQLQAQGYRVPEHAVQVRGVRPCVCMCLCSCLCACARALSCMHEQ